MATKITFKSQAEKLQAIETLTNAGMNGLQGQAAKPALELEFVDAETRRQAEIVIGRRRATRRRAR
jgi:hypothetical protein